MDEQSLWKLFFATGSPLVWLMIRRMEEEQLAKPAFLEQSAGMVEL